MAISNNKGDRDHAAFIENPDDQGTDRRVQDITGNTKLDAIIAALGGSVNTTATIYNISIAVANTEQSQALPANTKKFIIRTRGRAKLQLAYTSGDSSTNYLTVPGGSTYEDINLYTSQTVYFQSPKVGEIVELIAFT